MAHWGERMLSASVGGLVTFGAMYLVVVGRYVSRADVSQMISIESPYIRDQKWIADKLDSIQDGLEKANDKLDKLSTEK